VFLVPNSKNKVLWDFFANTKNLDKGLKNVQGGFKKTTGATDILKKGIGAVGLALGGREIAQWAGDAIQLAVAAEEVDSKFQAVFGSARNFTTSMSEWADMAGVTDTKARDLAATFGNLAMSQGISKQATMDLTEDVATLAGDMASFNDADPAAVFDTLTTAINTAERDGLKKFGIAVSQAEVEQRALTIAIAAGRDEITQADKSLAAYQLIAKKAGKANGDLERTQDSLANQQRQTTASFAEFQEEIGKELLPAYQDLMTATVKLLPELKLVVKGVSATIGPINMLADAVEALSDPVQGAKDGFKITGKEMKKWADTVMLVVNPAAWAMGRAADKVSEAVYGTGDALVDSALEMEEYKRGIDETAQAMRDAKGITEEYIGFAKQIRDEQEKHDARNAGHVAKITETAKAMERLKEAMANPQDPFDVFDTRNWEGMWGDITTTIGLLGDYAAVIAGFNIPSPGATVDSISEFERTNGIR